MRDRLIYYLLLICFFGGIFIMLGTAGASDLEDIGLIELIIQGVGGLTISLIGFFGLKIGGYGSWQNLE